MKTVTLGPFLGINNRLPNFAPSRRRERSFLKSAENVDIDNAGRLRSRPGVTLIQAMTGAHSLFLTSDTAGYLVRASSLYAITLPTHTETREGTVRNTAMSYVMHAGEVYCSNATQALRLVGSTSLSDCASYAQRNRGFPQRRAACRKAPIRCPRATGTAPRERKAGFSLLQHHAGERGRNCRDAAGDDHRATHVNVYLSRTNGGVPYSAGVRGCGHGDHTATALATGREITGTV